MTPFPRAKLAKLANRANRAKLMSSQKLDFVARLRTWEPLTPDVTEDVGEKVTEAGREKVTEDVMEKVTEAGREKVTEDKYVSTGWPRILNKYVSTGWPWILNKYVSMGLIGPE